MRYQCIPGCVPVPRDALPPSVVSCPWATILSYPSGIHHQNYFFLHPSYPGNPVILICSEHLQDFQDGQDEERKTFCKINCLFFLLFTLT